MEIVLGWLIFAIIAGIIAAGRGRSGLGFFLLSVVLSPLVGILLAVALPDVNKAKAREAELADSRKCPNCAEMIKREASVCRYCGRDVAPLNPQGWEAPKPPPVYKTALAVILTLLAFFAVISWFALPSPTQAPVIINAAPAEPRAAPPPAPSVPVPKAPPKAPPPKPPLQLVPQ